MSTEMIAFNPVIHAPLVALHLQGVDVDDLSKQFSLPIAMVLDILNLPEAKRLQTTIIANTGYNNAAKRATLIERMIDEKLETQEDAYSSKDLSSLLRLALDNAKAEMPTQAQTTVNVDNSKTTTNYHSLLEKIYASEDAAPVDAEVVK